MITTSSIPKEWVDKPYAILTSPQGEGLDIKCHFSVELATGMTHVHNMFIRALNSLTLQSPHITLPADIADLLYFTKILLSVIHEHHDSEEKYLFPALAAYTKNPDVMSVNEEQHKAFHSSMEALDKYCKATTPETYSYETYSTLLNTMAGPLYTHLKDEIPSLLSLSYIPSPELKKMWDDVEKHVLDNLTMDEMFPMSFGCIDKGFEGSIKNHYKFPPTPKIANYLVEYWFSRKHKGVWRFNPSDMWGKPRELVFLPKEAVEAK